MTSLPAWFRAAISAAILLVTGGVVSTMLGVTGGPVLLGAGGQVATIAALVLAQQQRDRP